jgi:hypothetical protein
VRTAPLRDLNPFFARRVARSSRRKTELATIGGWPHAVTLHNVMRAGRIAATPSAITRLERVADAIGFPRDEIFLDEAVSR